MYMKQKQPVTVFGATGRVGSELLLLLTSAGVPVNAVSRSKRNVTDHPLVKWVQADMNNKSGLYEALEDASAVFLSSAAYEGMVDAQCHVIDVAVEQGVTQIAKLSSAMADAASPLFIPRAHGQIEEHLKQRSAAGILLRPTGFMQNWLNNFAPTSKAQRKIYEATGDGKRAHIDLRDIAEVAFRVLTDPGKYACHAFRLSGGQALNAQELAGIISRVIGETVTYIPVSGEAAAEQMKQKGLPQWTVETFLAYAEEQRTHQAGWISDDVPDILGRPARTAEAFITEFAAAFR
ncbi:NmrA domain-containing protein [Chitinophaga sp. 180180018-2]|nr:NmrA domain-containing protein [Chitinophaga sp. 212800010-3]